MKKVSVIAAGLVVLVTGYFLFFDTDEKITNYPSSGTTIIAFGDSLVEGVGSTKNNDFVSKLSSRIKTPIINLGKSGDTTKEALTRLDDVLENNPKIVLLLLGGNDYLRKSSKEETFSNLGLMIESIQHSGSIVILLGVKGGILKDEYKDDFKELSKKYGTAYVPNVLDGVFGHPDLMSDTIHPNDAGYEIIAEKIYPVIKELID